MRISLYIDCRNMSYPYHPRRYFCPPNISSKLSSEKHSQEETRTCRKSEGRRSEMEKVSREKMQVREKVGNSRNTVFFQCFVAPEGRKVGSLKRRVRRHLGR